MAYTVVIVISFWLFTVEICKCEAKLMLFLFPTLFIVCLFHTEMQKTLYMTWMALQLMGITLKLSFLQV